MWIEPRTSWFKAGGGQILSNQILLWKTKRFGGKQVCECFLCDIFEYILSNRRDTMGEISQHDTSTHSLTHSFLQEATQPAASASASFINRGTGCARAGAMTLVLGRRRNAPARFLASSSTQQRDTRPLGTFRARSGRAATDSKMIATYG